MHEVFRLQVALGDRNTTNNIQLLGLQTTLIIIADTQKTKHISTTTARQNHEEKRKNTMTEYNKAQTSTIFLPSEQSFYRGLGDATNILSIVVNLALTIGVMTGSSLVGYDKQWLQRGFCVRQDHPVATESLCFLFLVGAAIAAQLYLQGKKMNPQLDSKIKGAIFSNLAHGGGHLFLYLIGGQVPKVDFTLSPEGIGYVFVLLFFWTGTLKAVMISVSTAQSLALAVAAIGLQYLLDVPAELSFTYTQSLLLMAGSLDQLNLPRDEKSFTYLLVAASYLPLFAFFITESTQCSEFFADWGGHALYDLYLAMLPFGLYFTVSQHEKSTPLKAKFA